jgi:DNA-directed RNA polymerase II subunit RPB2
VLAERLFEQSDPFVATVCGTCGLLANPAAEKTLVRDKKPHCSNCKTGNVRDVRMPYAFKLLLQELMTMSIATRLTLKDRQGGHPVPPVDIAPRNRVESARLG